MLENEEDNRARMKNLKASPGYEEAWYFWSVWQRNYLLKSQVTFYRKETRHLRQSPSPQSLTLGVTASERNSLDPYWENTLKKPHI